MDSPDSGYVDYIVHFCDSIQMQGIVNKRRQIGNCMVFVPTMVT